MVAVKRDVAISRLHEFSEKLDRFASLWDDEPWAVGAYVYGDVLSGAERFELQQLAFVLDLPPEEVTWRAMPQGGEGLVHHLRLDKYPVEVSWRPAVWPVWNHHVRAAVQFWSPGGAHEAVIDALADRRLDDLPIVAPPDEAALRANRSPSSWTPPGSTSGTSPNGSGSRSGAAQHTGLGTYPEDHLWRAASGLLELMDAAGR